MLKIPTIVHSTQKTMLNKIAYSEMRISDIIFQCSTFYQENYAEQDSVPRNRMTGYYFSMMVKIHGIWWWMYLHISPTYRGVKNTNYSTFYPENYAEQDSVPRNRMTGYYFSMMVTIHAIWWWKYLHISPTCRGVKNSNYSTFYLENYAEQDSVLRNANIWYYFSM